MMGDLTHILQILDSGSDVAIIFFGWAIWRIERRVFTIETKLTGE